MARIRTFKPEFFTDERLGECSLSSRFLFLGTWAEADDYGNLDRSAKQLKVRIFPFDDLDCEPLLQELLAQGLLVEYSVSEKIYLHIPNFNKHQKIDRPSKPRFPDYDDSLLIQRTLAESSMLKGREGSRVESKGVESVVGASFIKDSSSPPNTLVKKNDRKQQAIDVLEFLNAQTNAGFRPVDSNLSIINGRFDEGFTVRDLKRVVQMKWEEWKDRPDMLPYLRPATLFGKENFANYHGLLPPLQPGDPDFKPEQGRLDE